MIKNIRKVRLSDHDLAAIKHLFKKHFLQDDKLWLFGSRVNLAKRGGDIDLYIETMAETVEQALKMKTDFIWGLEQEIGEQKIDVVLNMVNNSCSLPIHKVALTEGVRII